MQYIPFRQVGWLALRDFQREPRVALCLLLALLAVLAPLLVLFGLKFGLIDTLTRRLVEFPHNRELVAVGNGRYDAAWFQRLAARPDVAFVLPNTRSIAASFSALRDPRSGAELRAVAMLPTAPGDPLLTTVAPPSRDDQVALSALAARKLGVAAGAAIEARLDRLRNDRPEQTRLMLQVIGVLPEALLPGERVLAPLDLLTATEDYRDGVAVPRWNWAGAPAPAEARVFARFRLYAKSIYEVAPLRDALLSDGIETHTQVEEIDAMQLLDRNLSRVFWLLAALGSVGFLASLAANLLASVDRKRRELSILRFLGFPTRSLLLFPLTQAALIAALGGGGAVLAYWLVAGLLNIWFAASLQAGELICRLRLWHIGFALLATLGCALTAAAWAGHRAARIEPAAGVRDV